MRASATACKKEEKREKGKEGVSLSAPKVIGNGAPKRKDEGKDNRLFKKAPVTPKEKQPKNLSPSKPGHGTGKGLMTALGPVTQGTRCLLTYKGQVIEIVESIIREMDMDPYAKQETEDLGASGLFYLSRVCSLRQFYFIVYLLADGCNLFSGTGAYEGAPRQVRR